ncbi:MAG: tetratricopeptide repeat protein [Phycisphaeraceae bacterium]|nr:tetratricopeptide repeat protein [Phycisphaeraceae bacterium]
MSQHGLDTVIGTKAVAADPRAAAEHFERGLTLEGDGQRWDAIEEFRLAVEKNRSPAHLFRLAFVADLLGFDDEALRTYEEIATLPEPPINALVNLAILLEDRGDFARAERLLRKVLDTDPNHPRARLFIRDVQASKTMYYDEDLARDAAKQNAILDTAIGDFELSVRSRNCLKKMQIRTIGDLLRITEAELLSYKNFGETSLVEIRSMLASKGLRLGQALDSGHYARIRREVAETLKGTVPDTVLNRPVGSLELSVRARKALQLLNVQTLGDLASRTEAELMGIKNFGQTSLEEIKARLQESGLQLRSLE